MIRYSLKCDQDHGFDSWFQSASTFDTLQDSRMVACPDCGSTTVEKAIMAPRVRPARSAAVVPAPAAPAPETAPAKTPDTAPVAADKEAMLKQLKAKIEKESEYVGTSFVNEARAIHDGDAPNRAIYGEAKLEDAKKLVEDGVPVAPLPFIPTRKVN